MDNQHINPVASATETKSTNQKHPNSLVHKEHTSAKLSNERNLAIYITRPDETQSCDFWIGLYRSGNNSPANLLETSSVEEFYKMATEQGLSDDKPILLSDTALVTPKNYYLIPENDWVTRPDTAIKQIGKTLKALRPKKAGLYFCSDLVPQSSLTELFTETLIEAFKSSTREYYLFVGDMGINRLLNIAIDVKTAIERETGEEIFVFH